MINARSAAALGLGFGAIGAATLGMSAVAAQPEVIKAAPASFGITGRVVFVPWQKHAPITVPNDDGREIPQEFDEMEQALMLFAVASLNS